MHLAELQRILGHCGIATTVRYVHIADPQRRAAMTLHPLNDRLVQARQLRFCCESCSGEGTPILRSDGGDGLYASKLCGEQKANMILCSPCRCALAE